jgi:hypothetical protein
MVKVETKRIMDMNKKAVFDAFIGSPFRS